MSHIIEAWFDACVEPINPGGHGGAGIFVKVDGRVDIAKGFYLGHGHRMSNQAAEYQACIEVLKHIATIPGPAIIYGDSKLVIMQLQGKWRVNGGLYMPYYEEALKLYRPQKRRLKLQWIPRKKNHECDRLSKAELLNRGIKFKIQPE